MNTIRRREYRSFEEARAFVRALKLKNCAEWSAFSKGELPKKGRRPSDIPSNPGTIYAGQGWQGQGDWLGTGATSCKGRKYRSFESARAFARSLKLKWCAEWVVFCKGELPLKGKLPADIPANPYHTYKGKGFIGCADWLDTASQRPVFRAFSKAREFARKLSLRSEAEWMSFCRGKLTGKGCLPDDIPARPQYRYANQGWQGYCDWLGIQKKSYRSYLEARAFVRALKFKNTLEWSAYRQGLLPEKGHLPADVPAWPHLAYAGQGWCGFADWLGASPQRRVFRPFSEAREFARALKLANQQEWREFCQGRRLHLGQRPADLPANPERVYATQGWQGYCDWLGVSPQRKVFRPFPEARAFARKLKLQGNLEWKAFACGALPHVGLRPADLPANPERVYATQGWQGIGDWLGTGRKRLTSSA